MRRDAKILLVTLAAGAAFAGADRVPDLLSDMQTFRVGEVVVRGNRYLSDDEVVESMRVSPESSVWTGKEVWVERLVQHPLIRTAEIRRRPPNGLLVTVGEREPVALAATPTLEPVDAEGYRLPLDPARYRLDLPLLATERRPASGAQLLPEEVRILAAEVGRLLQADTAFLQRVSDLSWHADGSVSVRWSEPDVVFLLRPGVPLNRLRDGLGALADAASKAPGDLPDEIDLRFADQVVVRRSRAQ